MGTARTRSASGPLPDLDHLAGAVRSGKRASASYENDSFQGTTRTDNLFSAGAGFRYLVNRNLFLGGTYSYLQRSSSLSGASYTQNILTLRLGTQF